jgi:hypothetical protein
VKVQDRYLPLALGRQEEKEREHGDDLGPRIAVLMVMTLLALLISSSRIGDYV